MVDSFEVVLSTEHSYLFMTTREGIKVLPYFQPHVQKGMVHTFNFHVSIMNIFVYVCIYTHLGPML